MEPGIGVRLKAALEALQVLPWMLALAIFRVRKPDRRSGVFPGRAVVAHIGPEATHSGLATAGREYRHRGVVGVKLVACEHVLLNRVHQRRKQLTCSTDPAGQRGALDRNSLASVNLRLAIDRKSVV